MYIPSFLKIGIEILHLYSSDILFGQKTKLNNLMSQTITTSLKLLHSSMGIPFRSINLSPFILYQGIFDPRFLNPTHKVFIEII
jgi:hypothetical protein